MKLIIGLGNPGPEYQHTRHNVGFILIDHIAQKLDAPWQAKSKFKASLAETQVGGQKILFAKPASFYNLSGEVVKTICDFYKLDPQDILVIHDELALPFGTLRVRSDGSDAGNNGIKNIITHVGDKFARIRVGTHNEHLEHKGAHDFVLDRFTTDELQRLPMLAGHTQKFVEDFILGDKAFAHTSVTL